MECKKETLRSKTSNWLDEVYTFYKISTDDLKDNYFRCECIFTPSNEIVSFFLISIHSKVFRISPKQ